ELEAIAAQLDPERVGSEIGGVTVDLSQLSDRGKTADSDHGPLVVDTPVRAVTVLVIEPSRVQAAIIKGFLQDHALEVVATVANGKDAIAAVRSLRPRAVISAMHLPDSDGISLAEQIRSEMRLDAP